jgi:acetyltransferase-like isoleucine patch superfamily enzyme
MPAARKLFLLATIILPQFLKKFLYRRVLGWKIGRRVRIGWSYLDAREVVLGDDVRVGHFNVVRGLRRLELGRGTVIANFNRMYGGDFREEWTGALVTGEWARFTSHHFLDLSGALTIGGGTTVAGRDTHFWTHEVSQTGARPELRPYTTAIGAGVYVGARSTLLCCSIPDGAVVGAGSVVTKPFPAEGCRLLIAGNPAGVKKRYPVTPEAGAAPVRAREAAAGTPVNRVAPGPV